MALAACLGLNTRQTFTLLCGSTSWSWMLENRVPQMLNADWTLHSALAIFVKDLGIVLDEAKRLGAFSPVLSNLTCVVSRWCGEGVDEGGGCWCCWTLGGGCRHFGPQEF